MLLICSSSGAIRESRVQFSNPPAITHGERFSRHSFCSFLLFLAAFQLERPAEPFVDSLTRRSFESLVFWKSERLSDLPLAAPVFCSFVFRALGHGFSMTQSKP